MKMLKHDIADKKFLEIIEKFLKAGIMENGKYRIELAKKRPKYWSLGGLPDRTGKEWIMNYRTMPLERIFKNINVKACVNNARTILYRDMGSNPHIY